MRDCDGECGTKIPNHWTLCDKCFKKERGKMYARRSQDRRVRSIGWKRGH